MNLRNYYAKIRETEAELTGSPVVVVSLETPDGGRAGVASEVPRQLAARMIVDGRARVATIEEIAGLRDREAQERRAAEQMASANRVQLTVISPSELRSLRGQKAKE
jgi:hypothetical protein